ncbi:MAG: hypothetical protein M3308_06500 [Actinomycetota bacterium]|nr:hypothetical protein [Actinomycetota bacterium]
MVTGTASLGEPPQPGWLDRDGRRRLLNRLQFAVPNVALISADGASAGRLVHGARQVLRVVIQNVHKPAGEQGFAVLSRRWVAERTLPWLMRCRRLVRNYSEDHQAMVK